MIPKHIHCVWLSGDPKPDSYIRCMQTWKEYLPDYEVTEWNLTNLPEELRANIWVSTAIESKKWAFATDFIRIWLLYNYGGIYLDMDVMVFKSFDGFLKHRFFSSIELYPEAFYKSINTKNPIGLGIEAAVLGSEARHPYLKDVMDYYSGKKFVNSSKFYINFIMPRVLTSIARNKYGFKLIPNYQILPCDMHIYPCDVFSSIFDFNKTMNMDRTNENIKKLGESPIRYTLHLCHHGWWEKTYNTDSRIWKVKNAILRFLGKS